VSEKPSETIRITGKLNWLSLDNTFMGSDIWSKLLLNERDDCTVDIIVDSVDRLSSIIEGFEAIAFFDEGIRNWTG
jgi:hypothetical protein